MNATPKSPKLPATASWLAAPRTESPAWKSLLDGLLPERPIAEMSLQGGNVLLSRSMEQDSEGRWMSIWTKRYGKTYKHSSQGTDLSVFNGWESDLIDKAAKDRVTSAYRLAALHRYGSPIHTGDTAIHLRKSSSVIIKTHHAGADLDRWRLMRPWADSEKLDHPFVHQAQYLKLIKGVLKAAHVFHTKRFVHCDFYPRNIVLSAVVKALPDTAGTGERYQVTPQWDDVTFIDLGYSLHQGLEPHAMLPLSPWELAVDAQGIAHYKRDSDGNQIPSALMSPHLRDRLLKLDAIAQTWPDHETYKREKWEAHQKALNTLQEIDWREDMYQLGHWLCQVRDGDAGHWGKVYFTGPHPKVNNFICTFPEELMQWGHTAKPDIAPHVSYLKRIDELLDLLPKPAASFILHRRDHDPAYATYLDQSAHRQARRRSTIQQAVRAGALLAGLTGLVGAGHYGLQAWQTAAPVRGKGPPVAPPLPPATGAPGQPPPAALASCAMANLAGKAPGTLRFRAEKSTFFRGDSIRFQVQTSTPGYLSFLLCQPGAAQGGDSVKLLFDESVHFDAGSHTVPPDILPLIASAPTLALGTNYALAVLTDKPLVAFTSLAQLQKLLQLDAVTITASSDLIKFEFVTN